MNNVVAKGWGHELWIVNTERYCGKQLTVLPRKWCSIHYHKIKDETFYVLDGTLMLEYAGSNIVDRLIQTPGMWNMFANRIELQKGDSFRISPGQPHRFTSNTNHPCTFIEFSTHHSDDDSHRIVKGD